MDILQIVLQILPWAVNVIVFIGMTVLQWRVIDALDRALGRQQTVPPVVIPPPAVEPIPKPPIAPPVHPPIPPPAHVPPPLETVDKGFEPLKAGYHNLWTSMTIPAARQGAVTRDAEKVLGGKSRYEVVSVASGVPWWVIGTIHMMEGSCDFNTHLHNGDPLSARTVHVPAGRPPVGQPPFTWEISAEDALQYEGFDKVKDWSIEHALYQLERFNGLGYMHKNVNSPYLWSFSNQYEKGKFVKDGVFDANAVSQQVGAAPIIKTLAALDATLQL
jgi:lysozyme family protein